MLICLSCKTKSAPLEIYKKKLEEKLDLKDQPILNTSFLYEPPELFLYHEMSFETTLHNRRSSIDELSRTSSSSASSPNIAPYQRIKEFLKTCNGEFDNEDFHMEINCEGTRQNSFTNFASFLSSDLEIEDSVNYNSIFESIISMDTGVDHESDTSEYELSTNTIKLNDSEKNDETISSEVKISSSMSDSMSSINSLASLNYEKSPKTKARSLRQSLNCLNKSLNTCENILRKNKKYRPRCERVKYALKFYKRQRCSTLQVNHPNNILYRPSFKVEKLLKDSRGMRKYLIDYDILMLQNNKNDNQSFLLMERLKAMRNQSENFSSSSSRTTFSDVESLKRLSKSLALEESSKRLSSNRCSSGYLSDC